jgi:transposase
MSRPRKYPEELLERGVRLALESERPIAHVAADLGGCSHMTTRRHLDRVGAAPTIRPRALALALSGEPFGMLRRD